MSTWLYLVCRDHEPPLVADAESGQHLSDLRQIREDIAHRDDLLRLWREVEDLDMHVEWDDFRRRTARFLREHPTCRIGIKDEYGREHPIEPEGT